MEQRIFDHVKRYCESKGWGTTTEEDIIDVIREGKKVWQDEGDVHRWYIMHTRVVCIDGMFIGFHHAVVTGDNSAEDMGIDFDKNSIREYEAKEKVVVVYEPKAKTSIAHQTHNKQSTTLCEKCQRNAENSCKVETKCVYFIPIE